VEYVLFIKLSGAILEVLEKDEISGTISKDQGWIEFDLSGSQNPPL
jgi:hypothetical protein